MSLEKVFKVNEDLSVEFSAKSDLDQDGKPSAVVKTTFYLDEAFDEVLRKVADRPDLADAWSPHVDTLKVVVGLLKKAKK